MLCVAAAAAAPVLHPPGSLQLFQADLLHPDHPGLVGAVQGAHYVFHVARWGVTAGSGV